jgi:hypothetical protein
MAGTTMKLPVMRIVTPLALVTLAACSKDSGVSAGYFGKTVEPPRGLAKLRPGMTRDEVKAATPDLKEGKGIHEGDWFLDSGSSDVQLEVEFDDDRVQELIVKAKTTKLEPMLTEAWGPAKKEVDRYSKEERAVWLDEAAGWRAELSCLERMCFLYFKSYKPLTAGFFGKTPVPPGAYAKLRVGMPAAEAATLLGDPLAVEKYVAAGPDDVSIIAQTSSQTQTVSSVRLMLPKESKELLTQAWGAGAAGKDSIDRPLTVWLDEATGWRAIWEDQPIGDSGSLEFTNYLSLPALLGDGGDGLAAFPTPILGKTKEELAQAYPALWKADDEVFELPPTAWGSNWTRVNTYFDDAGKLTGIRLGIPYEGQATAKADLQAAFDKRWGAPKPGEDLGRPTLIYRDAPPAVVVSDQTITGEWEITYGAR